MGIFEFLLLTFKPELQPDPSSPIDGFSDVVAKFKTVPGAIDLYLGQVIENPKKWQYIVHWESTAAHEAFLASPIFPELQHALGTLLAEPPIINNPCEYTHNVEDALNAPCTEVCTCWGTEEGFHETNMSTFADRLDAAGLSDFRGMARAAFVQSEHPDPSVVPGRASRIILGWDSKEAHSQHKDVGSVIDKNVHLVMERRKALDMYHVSLQKI